ncbi:MAG: ABC transporter permease, partial [Burkholderiales bacterium]
DWGAQAAAFVADLLSLLLPRLDAFTQTAWLLDAQPLPITGGSLVIQVLVYVFLLLAAAMFDLYRRSF